MSRAYRLFTIYERKPRLIAAAPFRDRVVHHAVMAVLEPLLERRLIFDTYACRVGKGVHKAVARYRDWAQRYTYALKLDIARYFPSVDQRILKSNGLDLLGYRVYPGRRLLRNSNGHRFARHLRALARAYALGRADWSRVDASVQAWIGHAGRADTWGLRERIFSGIVFRQGAGQRAEPGDPRRLVEQQADLAAFCQP